jgi:hypothetical protein
MQRVVFRGPSIRPATESQTDIDTAVDNAVNGKNLVAWVALDYTAHTGVNGGKPFIRFLIVRVDSYCHR